jgi:flagellar basal-body rod modification protein FlgD
MSVVSGTGAAGSAGDYPQGTSSVKSPAVDKNMFLQLLVAQLRNQDPMNPTDGTAFIGQLAQFQQLEQSINTGQDIAAIRNSVDTLLAASSAVATQS